MSITTLTATSPIDGRYYGKTKALSAYFSEFGLIKYRLTVEVEYFIALCRLPLPQLASISPSVYPQLRLVYEQFSINDAESIKTIEKTTNHDVKAVEYFLKQQFEHLNLGAYKEFIHFGLTSQDINNTAVPLSLRDALNQVYFVKLEAIQAQLLQLSEQWQAIPMLSRTHGQAASPTLLGKELRVFHSRIAQQIRLVQAIPHSGKFGGAVGNFNAHYVAYPNIDWITFGNDFLVQLGLDRLQYTTQIEHYDNMSALFHGISRINTILIDACRDIWTYISMNYFKQKIKKGEVGSSTMPHKVNPIDFENAEGNLGLANAIFGHLSDKLPVSRLQRDLTDSTVSRNIGVPLAHTLIAFESLLKGLNKLLLNEAALATDLDNHWEVVTEAIQTILRREGYPNPYEALKALSRTHTTLSADSLHHFIDTLALGIAVKQELKAITPFNYVGKV